MLGILLIHKHSDLTSHDVVYAVRRRFSTKRVGHAGTLDPLATGLLVVAVGPATRFLQYLPLEPKEYVAQITLGKETSTYDGEGEIVREAAVPADLMAAIQSALPPFTGLIQQFPPMYSAVKIDGQPLYKYARQGKEIEREARTVHIGTFDVRQISTDTVEATIVCSGGTYVRSLAHDLGQAMGCGAYLSGLVRTKVGRFELDEAVSLDDLSPADLIPLREALHPMTILDLDPDDVHAVREGQRIDCPIDSEDQLFALAEPGGAVFSVARREGTQLQPECVIPAKVGEPHGI